MVKMHRPMHGHLHRFALAVLAAALIPAAPAAADETLGLSQPAAVDGVVSSFTITGATGQTVRLRSLQGAATTATSDPVSAGAGAIAARLPIGAGGTLALVGASGSPTASARVEPDADGDGYGDTTQDPCSNDYTDHTRPCGPTLTYGSPLTLAPDPRGFSGSGSPMQAVQDTSSGVFPFVTTTGIVTRWRMRGTTTGGDTVLQVLRPDQAGATFTVVAQTAAIHVTSTDVVAVPSGIPVRRGDRIAARSVTGDLGTVAYRAGDKLSTHQPPTTTIGQSFTPDGTANDLRLLVQADVEPDADGDGKGDLTQDSADLVLTGSAPAEADTLATFGQTYVLRNAGPDKALETAIAFVGNSELSLVSDRPGVACGGGENAGGGDPGTTICRFGTLQPGEAATITLGRNSPDTMRFTGSVVTEKATASAVATDPDPTNNSVTLSTSRRPYIPASVPQKPLVAPPCANVIRGTRDDDVLRGTAFGDRLVGGDGDDLLKGQGADDCLEGGAGADVMDGGDGNDRLAGSSGRDRLIGGKGDDKLTGGKGNDRLTGGSGNDTLSPGAGHDAIDGGAGNDTINSVDGVRETVICGRGRDTVRADRRDHLRGCEKVTRKR
jgi:Ca2+-binding RTX toxin-like protein